MNQSSNSRQFPIKGEIKIVYICSYAIALFTLIASAAGLLFTEHLYPTKDLLQSFLANDVVNIVIGLPILLAAMWATSREKLAGLLLWPGALFFAIYNYLIYAISMPVNAFYIIYPAIVVVSVLAIIWLLSQIDSSAVKETLQGRVAAVFAGIVLVLFGLAFGGRAISIIISSNNLPLTELGLNLADTILSISWILTGFWLLRKKRIGYVLGMGMLFQGSMLFIGLIALMLLQPRFGGQESSFGEIMVILAMGLIVFIPFGLFLRGVSNADKSRRKPVEE